MADNDTPLGGFSEQTRLHTADASPKYHPSESADIIPTSSFTLAPQSGDVSSCVKSTESSTNSYNEYLLEMDANFLTGFNCCNINLHSLHDLLLHFEIIHFQDDVRTTRQFYPTATSSDILYQSSKDLAIGTCSDISLTNFNDSPSQPSQYTPVVTDGAAALGEHSLVTGLKVLGCWVCPTVQHWERARISHEGQVYLRTQKMFP